MLYQSMLNLEIDSPCCQRKKVSQRLIEIFLSVILFLNLTVYSLK